LLYATTVPTVLSNGDAASIQLYRYFLDANQSQIGKLAPETSKYVQYKHVYKNLDLAIQPQAGELGEGPVAVEANLNCLSSCQFFHNIVS
jgi:hypothetical protein